MILICEFCSSASNSWAAFSLVESYNDTEELEPCREELWRPVNWGVRQKKLPILLSLRRKGNDGGFAGWEKVTGTEAQSTVEWHANSWSVPYELGRETRLQSESNFIQTLEMNWGVRQGCSLSSNFFKVYKLIGERDKVALWVQLYWIYTNELERETGFQS